MQFEVANPRRPGNMIVNIKVNATHGLPLSQADRTAAARRILIDYPQYSNQVRSN